MINFGYQYLLFTLLSFMRWQHATGEW